MKHLFLFLFCLFILALTAEAGEKKRTSEAQPGSHEVMVRMDDGTQLATDVYLPSKKGKVPAVLVRTPYNKASEAWMEKGFHKLGIAAVVQDCRGKYNSKGEFSPFINERADGLATLRWIRSQPWSDGTVAGWGGSYVGYTQWAISDSLDFLTPLLTGASLYDLIYPDDMFSLHLAFLWGFLNASATANPIPPEKIYAGMNMLPLSAADDSVIRDLDFMNDWLSHQSYDNYWKKLDHKAITSSPLVSIAGWYDIFLEGQIKDFQALEKSGNHSGRLVIGPWCHGNPGEKNDYGGKKKTGEPGMILKYMKDFLDRKELKLKSPLKDEKYNLFIMERNEYAGSDVWPPRETRITPFYLTGGSSLDTLPPRESGSTGYHYDPADPYPSIGGTILGAAVGPARQNPNTGRKDQQVFTRPVGDKPLVLLGPLSATLWLSSQVKCTDFVVCIQDEFPDGKIINIQEGAAHVTFSGPEPEKKEISVWATGYQLNPGHKLRVVITSSWFPRYSRSLNTCDPLIGAKDITGADQTIWFGTSEPSSVNLPVYQIK